jgi:hypothetical protein
MRRALLLGRPAYLQLVAVAFLDGVLFVTSYICERGALRQVLASDQLQDAVATTMSMSLVWLGPLAVGYLFQHSGLSFTLLVAADWIFVLAVVACCSPAIRRYRAA